VTIDGHDVHQDAIMNRRQTLIGTAAFAVGGSVASTPLAARVAMPEQKPSAGDPGRRQMERRAAEAVIWGMPVVNFDLMLQAMIGSAKGKPNQIVHWSRLPDWKNQTLTPNPDVIYLMPFIDTRDVGPMVVEIPPAEGGSITGTILDAWQVPLEDVGPAGADKGTGGKYLVLPPGHSAPVPDGYIILPSATYQGYGLLRSILKSGSDADMVAAVAYARRIKLYPLSQAENPPPTVFVDAIDVVFDATIPYDQRFFRSLARPRRAGGTMARPGQGDDRRPQIGRHRERQAFQSRCESRSHAGGRRA
jgi:hypothetical protein